jgi:hypothetical protein
MGVARDARTALASQREAFSEAGFGVESHVARSNNVLLVPPESAVPR